MNREKRRQMKLVARLLDTAMDALWAEFTAQVDLAAMEPEEGLNAWRRFVNSKVAEDARA